MQSEDAYYSHLVLRLMGCFVLFYTSKSICKGRMTMKAVQQQRFVEVFFLDETHFTNEPYVQRG